MSGWAAAGAVAGQLANTALSIHQSNKAWQRQKKVLKNQHQWEVQDLKAAGLNPILSTMSHATAPSVNTASSDLDIASALAAENAQRQQANQDALTGAQISEIQSRIALNNASTAKEFEQAKLTSAQTGAIPSSIELNKANAQNAAANAVQVGMVNEFNRTNPQIFRVGQAHKAMPTPSVGGIGAVLNEGINDVVGGARKVGGSVMKWIGQKINTRSAPNNATARPTMTNSQSFYTDYEDK